MAYQVVFLNKTLIRIKQNWKLKQRDNITRSY